MKKRKKEKPVEAVIYENSPLELMLARLHKRSKKDLDKENDEV